MGGAYLPLGFMTTAVVLFASEKLCTAKLRPLDAKSGFVSGVLQGIAVLPGISRSGATIAALRFCGVEKSAAAEFSFLLSVPVILGSALYEGSELALTGELGGVDPVPLLIGVAAAFLSGLAAIRFFLSVVAKSPLSHSPSTPPLFPSSPSFCCTPPRKPAVGRRAGKQNPASDAGFFVRIDFRGARQDAARRHFSLTTATPFAGTMAVTRLPLRYASPAIMLMTPPVPLMAT